MKSKGLIITGVVFLVFAASNAVIGKIRRARAMEICSEIALAETVKLNDIFLKSHSYGKGVETEEVRSGYVLRREFSDDGKVAVIWAQDIDTGVYVFNVAYSGARVH